MKIARDEAQTARRLKGQKVKAEGQAAKQPEAQ